MQQSVLLTAVRGPDGVTRNHPVKIIMRWLRRCVLLSAFDKRALLSPYEPGGGSFTGPFTSYHLFQLQPNTGYEPNPHKLTLVSAFEYILRENYLLHTDELPHHFQVHLMQAAEILGYCHPILDIARWWYGFYNMIVKHQHLFPETKEQMEKRLGDNEADWRARE